MRAYQDAGNMRTRFTTTGRATGRGTAAPAAAGTRRSAGARRRSAACRSRTRRAGPDPRVLAGVEVTERAGHRVRHGHAQVVVAVRLDRDPDGGGELGEPLPDPPGGVAADGVAVPHPRRAGGPGRSRERAQVP